MTLDASHIDKVLAFWFEELTPDDWFGGGETVDDRIRERFLALHEALRDEVPESWRATARGMLAAVIALDQFPRNMYRGDAQAFAADPSALALATEGIERPRPGAVERRTEVLLPSVRAQRGSGRAGAFGGALRGP